MRAALDVGQISAAAAYLSEDVVVRLGNREPVFGAGGFTSLQEQMTNALGGVGHEVHDVWTAAEDPDVLIVNLTAHCLRLDRWWLSMPCCAVVSSWASRQPSCSRAPRRRADDQARRVITSGRVHMRWRHRLTWSRARRGPTATLTTPILLHPNRIHPAIFVGPSTRLVLCRRASQGHRHRDRAAGRGVAKKAVQSIVNRNLFVVHNYSASRVGPTTWIHRCSIPLAVARRSDGRAPSPTSRHRPRARTRTT
jgi:hypothetical protein